MKLLTKDRQQRNSRRTTNAQKSRTPIRRKRTTEVKRLDEQSEAIARSRQENQQLNLENQSLRAQLRQFQQADQDQPVFAGVQSFCIERGLVNHKFGARMITLCVNLARSMSFRSVPVALRQVFEALEITASVPSHDSVEHWSKRVGLAQLKKTRNCHKDWLWIVDHSNQIGQEKVLVILGIPASKLPAPGKTLSLDELEVLAIVPGKSWKRDDVRNVYRQVALHSGTPRFVVCDGAVELRETVDVLEKPGQNVVVLRDFKHFAANRFEKLVGKSEAFKTFCAAMGRTRCQVQQTELAYLTPPSLKTKARFMNVQPIVRWARLILMVLDDPHCEATADLDRNRVNEKFGWVEVYRDEIESWGRCCDLIESSLRWINTQGLKRDSGKRIDEFLSASRSWNARSTEGQLREMLVQFVCESGKQLRHGERAWLSSEAIESVFGRYKCREAQHSRSGFTGLIVSLPSLLRQWTPTEVRRSLADVSNKDMRQWTKENIGSTVASRRAKAYQTLRKTTYNEQATA